MVDEELHNYDGAVCKFFAVDRGHKQVRTLIHSILHINSRFKIIYTSMSIALKMKHPTVQLIFYIRDQIK